MVMKNDRRNFLKTAAVGGAALAIGSQLIGCETDEDFSDDFADDSEDISVRAGETPHDKKLFNKYFRVEVNGLYAEVPEVVSADAGKVTISLEETTEGDNPEYKQYTYGEHKYEDLTLTVMQGPGTAKLQKWFEAAMKSGGGGDALRRDISIFVLARDKSTVLKTINCFGCFPVSFNAQEHSTGSDIKTITLTCNMSRVEVA